ncbi:MAG: M23 family metallopeptidase [Desulfobacteraceae bacterium]|nr:M23 family metallopeptidase [Desulfobacteraceae bacterium]
MKINKKIVAIRRFIGEYPKKIIVIGSLFFILVLTVSMVDPGHIFSPKVSKIVSDFTTPDLMASPIKNITGIVKKGDSVSSLLNTYLPLKTIYDLDHRSQKIFPLTGIRQGQPYKISLLEDSLVGFEYEINQEDKLVIHKDKDTYSLSKNPIVYDTKQELISADIKTSLGEAVEGTGEDYSLAWKLADIFAWDIDFLRDIQPGDQFKVLVDKRYRNENFCGYSDIKAAFFINKGVEYKAFFYEDASGRKGYYDKKGHSLKKAFLKAPLNYSRISSTFSTRRFHPILHKYRAHPAVDYAAPKNTPIKTVADGIITNIGYNNSMGNHIIIRHSNGYETRYYHMNKYARGMKKNKKVSQGDVIGYVGKTGLATGYHLCFGMRKQGRPVNPLKQITTSAKPILQKDMPGFIAQTIKYSQEIKAANKLAQSN